MERTQASPGAGRPVAGTFSAIEASWRSTVESLCDSTVHLSPSEIEQLARHTVEEAVFRNVCRHRGINADSFGRALFQIEPNDSPTTLPSLDATALSCLNAAEIGPETLGAIHHRLLGLHYSPGKDGHPRYERGKTRAKAGGVFYTSEYVTRYMVDHAIDDDNPPPWLVDPACGCGAFLVAAYRRLRGAAARETILAGLHGVDLDEQAVLTARRALWLAAMESSDEPLSPIETEILFQTIRAGNALTGPVLDPLVGAFDLVLGNPPYRRERGAKGLLDQIAQTDWGRRWRMPRMDLWYYFAHRALDLLRDGGRLSLIVNSYWTNGSGAAKLIDQLRRDAHVEEIVDLDDLAVFDQVVGRHMIILVGKRQPAGEATIIKRPGSDKTTSAEPFLSGKLPFLSHHKTAAELFHDGRIDLEPVDHELLAALDRGMPLGNLGRVRQGIAENPATVNRQTNHRHGDRWAVGEGVFVLTQDEVDRLGLSEQEKTLLRPYHQPRDVRRYYLAEQPEHVLVYSTADTCPELTAYPTWERHLRQFRPIMKARRETREGKRPWWQLHWPREASLWTADKILSVQMARRPAFVSATRPVYVNFSVNVFVPDADTPEHLDYLTALLNSEPLWQWFRHHAKRRGIGLEINGRVLAKAPIHRIDFSDPAERRLHDELVDLARRMRAYTHQENSQETEPCETEVFSASEDACEHASYEDRIDAIVRGLYGLPT